MAAAYSALLSVVRSLNQILNLQQYDDPLHREKIVDFHEKIHFIVTSLENSKDQYCGWARNGIVEAADQAQDFTDSYLLYLHDLNSGFGFGASRCDRDHLNKEFGRILVIWEEVILKIKNSDTVEDVRPSAATHDRSSTIRINAENMVVGFDHDLYAIKERMYDDSAKLQIIPIVGMGGIGKTTLARKAYEDSILAQDFDIFAWVTVSAEYRRRDVLLKLLQSLNKFNTDQNEGFDGSEALLAKQVYQKLIGRRYLVVLDDIWSNKTWDELRRIFPDDGSGSRILLTTRLSDVAVHAGSSSSQLHEMSFLNGDQSWKLLQTRVFGQESCPLHMVELGTKIARNCGGLPLTIVVVAGLLLSTGNMTITMEELWGNISENMSSTESEIISQCSKILSLSYERLPLYLKPCFLYIASFAKDHKIDVSKLIKLWVAEGFLKQSDHSKCLEDVGRGYMEDLVSKSLILVSKRRPDGKIESVVIHDLLRDMGATKAQEEGFLHDHVSSKRDAELETINNPDRRLTIHCTQNCQQWRVLNPRVRSVLIFSNGYWGSKLSLRSHNLSVLNAPGVTLPQFWQTSKFINLRYIDFELNFESCSHGFPISISQLPNLETIIAHTTTDVPRPLQVPYEILEMPKLRHLIIDTPFCFTCPSRAGIICQSHLQTLETVLNFRLAEEVIKILVNLKTLKLVFEKGDSTWDDFNLNNLSHLQNLEELEVSMEHWHNPSVTPIILEMSTPMKGRSRPPSRPRTVWNHAFPISLKILALRGVPLPWENMSIIGSLPHLQVLRMLNIKVAVLSMWRPVQGQFLQLKYFLSSLDGLLKWEAGKEHFPSLERLILEGARLIQEIPRGLGDIDSLQLIELKRCPESLVNSAKRIQEQQHENGNDTFQVCVISDWRFSRKSVSVLHK